MTEKKVTIIGGIIAGLTGMAMMTRQKIVEDTMHDEWIKEFSNRYDSWFDLYETALNILDLKITDKVIHNSLTISKTYEKRCYSKSKNNGDVDFCGLVDLMNEKARLLAKYTEETFADKKYLQNNGYKMALNASVASMRMNTFNSKNDDKKEIHDIFKDCE